jgi:L-alanine-DL-glutamate epimerase-like enolase superfamily enzyme
LKVKGRPWFDLRAQIKALEKTVTENFNVSIDFNGTMQTAEKALPILRELEQSPIVTALEDPIAPGDIEGYRRLRSALNLPLISHYGSVEPLTAVRVGMYDRVVVNGGATTLREQTTVAAASEWPARIQLVGTGITAAMAIQFGATLPTGSAPAITCYEIYNHPLLTSPLPVADGAVPVPDNPGLGVRIDRDALERLQTERPEERPSPPRLIEASWPNGKRVYVAGDTDAMLKYACREDCQMPYFERDAKARLLPDDGSDAWRSLYERARQSPVVIGPDESTPLEEAP